MTYTVKDTKFPNLNILKAPSCIQKEERKSAFTTYSEDLMQSNFTITPRQEKIKIVKTNEKIEKNNEPKFITNLCISSCNNSKNIIQSTLNIESVHFEADIHKSKLSELIKKSDLNCEKQINTNKKISNKIKNINPTSKNIFFVISPENDESTQNSHVSDAENIDKKCKNFDLITEFNTNSKLKKIHSTYHLKRKISTKFQNDIKLYLNQLISLINMSSKNYKIPFANPNSKIFREDVKIESLKIIKNLTIGKFICEDIQIAGRSLNKNNVELIKKINKIYEIEPKNELIKKIFKLLNETIVLDYYENFIQSERFKECSDKDFLKYSEKLDSLNFTSDKKKLYQKIFRQKYEGIAYSYFDF